jgi:hypothetical protein
MSCDRSSNPDNVFGISSMLMTNMVRTNAKTASTSVSIRVIRLRAGRNREIRLIVVALTYWKSNSAMARPCSPAIE